MSWIRNIYLGPKIRNLAADNIKSSENIACFKAKIKIWKPKDYAKHTYLKQILFEKRSDPYLVSTL